MSKGVFSRKSHLPDTAIFHLLSLQNQASQDYLFRLQPLQTQQVDCLRQFKVFKWGTLQTYWYINP